MKFQSRTPGSDLSKRKGSRWLVRRWATRCRSQVARSASRKRATTSHRLLYTSCQVCASSCRGSSLHAATLGAWCLMLGAWSLGCCLEQDGRWDAVLQVPGGGSA